MNVSIVRKDALGFSEKILCVLGVHPDIAEDVAENLVSADMSGYSSHGISLLTGYHKALKSGQLNGIARPEKIIDSGVFQAWDGHRGFGQHVGKQAFLSGQQAAKQNGQCILTIRNSHHLGRLGFYAEMAAAEGLILLAFTNVINREPLVAPFGGAQGRLTTNPVCFGVPLPGDLPPLVVDMATSAIALNKARVLAENKKEAPEGSLIDAEGRATTDPSVMTKSPHGFLLPFGGHKGYALGVVTEMLAGVLSGGGTIQPARPREGLPNNNVFALLFNPAHPSFGGNAEWQEGELQAFVDYLLSCPPQPGGEGVQYPGQYEAGVKKRCDGHVIMGRGSWDVLLNLAKELNVSPPAV